VATLNEGEELLDRMLDADEGAPSPSFVLGKGYEAAPQSALASATLGDVHLRMGHSPHLTVSPLPATGGEPPDPTIVQAERAKALLRSFESACASPAGSGIVGHGPNDRGDPSDEVPSPRSAASDADLAPPPRTAREVDPAVADSLSSECHGRLCEQLHESRGGQYGCSLPAFHEGPHRLGVGVERTDGAQGVQLRLAGVVGEAAELAAAGGHGEGIGSVGPRPEGLKVSETFPVVAGDSFASSTDTANAAAGEGEGAQLLSDPRRRRGERAQLGSPLARKRHDREQQPMGSPAANALLELASPDEQPQVRSPSMLTATGARRAGRVPRRACRRARARSSARRHRHSARQ
jgi:hypothetical protein